MGCADATLKVGSVQFIRVIELTENEVVWGCHTGLALAAAAAAVDSVSSAPSSSSYPCAAALAVWAAACAASMAAALVPNLDALADGAHADTKIPAADDDRVDGNDPAGADDDVDAPTSASSAKAAIDAVRLAMSITLPLPPEVES